jgi:antitoxin VapB
MPQYARVFQSGNSQAIRLPKEFRVDVDEVEISREGDAIILRPRHASEQPWSALISAMDRGLTDDFLPAGREQPEPHDRPDLDASLK